MIVLLIVLVSLCDSSTGQIIQGLLRESHFIQQTKDVINGEYQNTVRWGIVYRILSPNPAPISHAPWIEF